MEVNDWTRCTLDRTKVYVRNGESCTGDIFKDPDPEWLPWTVMYIGNNLDAQNKQNQADVRVLCYDCVRQGKILEESCEHEKPEETAKGRNAANDA